MAGAQSDEGGRRGGLPRRPRSQDLHLPDHTEGGFTCKHYYAASVVHKRDVLPDGTVIEANTLTLTEKKVYKQDWPKYNAAQASEKRRSRVLLHDLSRRLPVRERAGGWVGPKPHLPADAVFTMAYKVYCGLSVRRFTTDLHEAHGMGFLSKPIPGMKATTFAEPVLYADPARTGRVQRPPPPVSGTGLRHRQPRVR